MSTLYEEGTIEGRSESEGANKARTTRDEERMTKTKEKK